MSLYAVLDFLSNGITRFSGWQVFFYTMVVTHITIASVTIYLHRCQAHRALDLHPIVSHFFRFWLWLTTGQVTKEWASIHRKHHAKCDTEEDPHSPVTRGIKKVFWEGAELYRAESKNKETMEKYGHGTPDDWMERNVYTRHSALGVASLLVINFALFGVIGITVWAVQMLWIPITAAGIINGIGHYWGYRNYDCADAATNIIPLGLLIGGEELHNNHHTFATSAKLSSKWYEFDIGWGYIRALEMVGLAKVKNAHRRRSSPRQAGSRLRHAAIGDRQPLRRDGQVRQIDQERLERRAGAPEAQGRAGSALPEIVAQAAAARAGQAGSAAAAAAVGTVPAQQGAGNHAQYARGTGRDLGAFALHARPAAA
jgi:stearoyl-CoA desaturase (delta-9 desaturase)